MRSVKTQVPERRRLVRLVDKYKSFEVSRTTRYSRVTPRTYTFEMASWPPRENVSAAAQDIGMSIERLRRD